MTTTEPINEVTVLGAGVMGAASAAHLANAGVRVRLLDIPPKDAPAADKRARNKIAEAGLEGARKAKPAAFFSPRFETLVSVGNLEDDLAAAVSTSDFIIEAVIENLAIKQKLYARIDELGGRAIVTSNTSGLRIAELMQGRSDSFKKRFCITHFFNPPRYLKLVEIVTGADTAPATVARAEALCGRLLGKGLVRAKDTPNFIANRIGTFAMMRTLAVAVEEGYTVEEVDMVFGPATGKPKSGVFRTADVVGLDTLTHVTKNCFDALTGDERRAVFEPPPVLKALVEKKWLGSKTKQGFYKKVGNDILQLDLKTLEYGPQKKPRSAGASGGSAGRLRSGTRSASRPRPRRWRRLGSPCPVGSRSRSPRRAKACASTRQKRRARCNSSASAAASRPSLPTRATSRSTPSAPRAARSSATAARRSSISATASSASSST